MSLKEVLNSVCGGLVDLHVGLNRARHFADEIYGDCCGEMRAVEELYEELDQMQREIERLMKEVT